MRKTLALPVSQRLGQLKQPRLLPAVDPRLYQISFLGGFLLLGILALGWQARLGHYAAALGGTLGTQAALTALTTQRFRSLLSALISGLALCLLLKTNAPLTMALAGVFAILSKYSLRWRGKHWFNPANFGIVAVLLLTPDAWVSPGQWGHAPLLLFAFAGAGLLVLGKVGRWDTTAVFLAVFGALVVGYQCLWLGWPLDHAGHQLSNGALLLFAFFMLTDPRSIPNARRGRLLWAACIALVAFALSTGFYVHTAIIWALFACAPLTLLLDHFFPASRFQWYASSDSASHS
jgi:Na+-transporting NADH:ubiquinone oxidoreductase subunit NqrB